MDIESHLTRKILDPIHGIIRLTALEIDFINHPLFQRLRDIKQNSFLYKVFPSAVHSRFEHSIGVLHLSNEILNNLRLNAIRYDKKYHDGHVFCHINEIPKNNIQELRLAALLHDIGHGPMSHQFDSFMPTKEELSNFLGDKYKKITDMLKGGDDKVKHEHMSLIFSLIIYNDLNENGRLEQEINIENIFKIIEKEYGDKEIKIEINNKNLDILPLMTSIISSCPIDADRMDYLLRDSYFTGVKCGIYDYNRLYMSIVPVEENNKLYLAYKESGIDSIAEFIGARSSLFSQVYFHKTNRSFSSMLDRLCDNMTPNESKNLIISELIDFSHTGEEEKLTEENEELLIDLYKNLSDDYFLNDKVAEWTEKSINPTENRKILDDLIKRIPWSKIYEIKYTEKEPKITEKDNGKLKATIKEKLSNLLVNYFNENEYTVDIVSDTAFKDINKTEVKLLVKKIDNSYEIKRLEKCEDKLNQYQSIKYFIRIFIDRDIKNNMEEQEKSNIITNIHASIENGINEYEKQKKIRTIEQTDNHLK